MGNIRHIAEIETHPDVMMDDCHIDLISALVLSSKPKTILEIGVGSGAVTRAIMLASAMNANDPEITLVDGFNDWNFKRPDGFDRIGPYVNFINSDEKLFIEQASESGMKYDFIVSDADHARTGEWADLTVALVNACGILIYHDADSIHCPSVRRAVEVAKSSGMSALMFNKNSHPWEQCHRGMCVLQNQS